jgi:nicotinate-nucleotide pyrophosphorylase (carboxylating)
VLEIPKHIIEEVVERAIKEDLPYGDKTTDYLSSIKDCPAKGFIKAKEKLVLAGIEVAKMVFEKIDPLVSFNSLKKDGDEVEKKEVIAIVSGKASSLLKGERIALNILSHLSGIATSVKKIATLLEGTDIKLVDTRKTLPGLRALQKYAVRIGGGYNHRFSLSDGILIKTNHIRLVGSLKEAVKEVMSKKTPFVKIEVEVKNMEELKLAIESKVDIIMLDNMSDEEIEEALSLIGGKAEVEVSGEITEERIKRLREMKGINYISMGSITNSARAVDINFEIMRDEG